MKKGSRRRTEITLTIVFVFYCVIATYISVFAAILSTAPNLFAKSWRDHEIVVKVTPGTILFSALALITVAAGVLTVLRLFSKFEEKEELYSWGVGLSFISLVLFAVESFFGVTFRVAALMGFVILFGRWMAGYMFGFGALISICIAVAALLSQILLISNFSPSVKVARRSYALPEDKEEL